MDKLTELRQKLGALVDELGTEKILADGALYDGKKAEIADVQGQITRLEEQRRLSANLARPSGTREPGAASMPSNEGLGDGALDAVASRSERRNWQAQDYTRHVRKLMGFTPDPQKHFTSFGEQLLAIASYYMHGRDAGGMDPRLVRAPTGAGEVDPSAGGFLVQTDFSTAVFMRAYDMGEILGRVQKLSLSTASNSIKIPAVDETSRVTGSRWGGVQSYWTAEGVNPGATKPKFRHIELDLKKLMSLMYVTDELLADTSVLTSIASKAFSEELMFMTEDAIFEGSGNGMPLGVMNSPALITVAKQTGQASKTIVYENVLAMWSRMWGRSRSNAVWFINQDNEPQLYAMSQVIGTAGVPVYLPANGISGRPYGTLFGRDVIPLEYNATLGTTGDIVLADYSQYVLADKGGVQAASSMHVAFLTDEMVFRFTYRVDGEPIWHAPLTPFKGTNTLSPFVVLAAR